MAGDTVFSSGDFYGLIHQVAQGAGAPQNEQENLRLDLLGYSPDFDVPPLDEKNDSVSLSVKWKPRIVFPL